MKSRGVLSAVLIACVVLAGVFVFSADRALGASGGVVIKVLAINPSKEFEQEVPIKTYLPQEVKPEDIINRDELQVGFDTEKSVYYVQKTVKLKPGESYTLMVRIEDIWTIPQENLQKLRERADSVMAQLEKEPTADVAKILHDNVIAAIEAIEANQKEERAPSAHIAAYRDNLKKLEEVHKDLASMESFIMAKPMKRDAFSGLGPGPGNTGKNPLVSSGFAWKLMLGIIGFLGILSFSSFVIWQKQLRGLSQNKEINMLPPDERQQQPKP